MSDKGEGLVPRLRFPEFRDAGEWKAKLLGAVCEMQAGKFVAASEISEKQADGLYPCFGGNGLRGYTKMFNQTGRYSLIGRQGALCGNVNFVEGNFYATEHAVVTIPKLGNNTDWLFYNLCLLNLNQFATGQAQPGLSIDVLEKVNCATPKDEKEQQKIADCLSSLDDLITAEAKKLNALKTHKKGLMQQLFPREGETVPRLRFPEFRDAGEWKRKKLKDACEVNPGGQELPEEFVYIDLESVESGTLKFRKIINRSDAPSRAQRFLRYGDVIFQIVRPYQRNNFYFKIEDSICYIASTGYAQLRAHESNVFLFHAIHTDEFVERVIEKCTGSSYPAINSSDLADISIVIPGKFEPCLSGCHTHLLDVVIRDLAA
ncbi:restriction endonuclease subunit S [Acidithiobacillus sp. MC6.1]|nr:restriction endonuclease subunit S [Acidithiobacillus sp. MC6.1]